jgi:hypothetical protein
MPLCNLFSCNSVAGMSLLVLQPVVAVSLDYDPWKGGGGGLVAVWSE